MQTITITQAKTNLTQFLKRGKTTLITKTGKPIATIIPYASKKQPIKLGLWKGKTWMSDDFNEEDKEINELFYGR